MVSRHSESLGGLFLKILDLRRIQLSPIAGHKYDIAEIRLVEGIAVNAAIAMVYKLNDITFRPMFSRMLEWATSPTLEKEKEAAVHRRTTWYTFLLEFFGSLKVCSRHST